MMACRAYVKSYKFYGYRRDDEMRVASRSTTDAK